MVLKYYLERYFDLKIFSLQTDSFKATAEHNKEYESLYVRTFNRNN